MRLILEHALAGRLDNLKERMIGAEMFGRPIDYDTANDAVVRVKANDVRRRLAEYYAEEGTAQDPVWIDLPIGTYVPEFHWKVIPEPTLSVVPEGPKAQVNIPFYKAAWTTAGIAALITAAVSFFFFYLHQKPVQAPVVRSTILPPENTVFSPYLTLTALPAVSPDGQHIAFSAGTSEGKSQLWVRPLSALSAQPLTGTENGSLPFWSPDGHSIGFVRGSELSRIDATGGPVTVLAHASDPHGASWSPQGVIVFAPNFVGPLRKIPASGGAANDVTKLAVGENSHRWPWFLPDGRHFVFSAGIAGQSRMAIRVGSLDTVESTKLLEADSGAIYSAGYLLFLRGSTLIAQPFDAQHLALTGEALPVAERVQSYAPGSFGAFSASASGLLAYAGGARGTDLAWFDRKGTRLSALGEDAQFFRLNFSPDRTSLAISIMDQASGNMNIWLYDVARGLRRRATFDPASYEDAVWSPDGRTILFDSTRKGHYDLYRKSANGSGAEELLYADNREKRPTSISPDGKFLLYFATGDSKTVDLWILPGPLGAPGAAKPYPFMSTPFNELWGQFSPDGRWITYEME